LQTKGPIKLRASKFRPKEWKQWKNIKEKDRFIIIQEKEVVQKKYLSITGCKHPLIASGATTIGSASHAPDEISTRIMQLER
jgi:hypothetical protein